MLINVHLLVNELCEYQNAQSNDKKLQNHVNYLECLLPLSSVAKLVKKYINSSFLLCVCESLSLSLSLSRHERRT